MVNENFEKFKKEQKQHPSQYLGNVSQPRLNDEEYNNQENTDKAIGATGRKIDEQIQ